MKTISGSTYTHAAKIVSTGTTKLTGVPAWVTHTYTHVTHTHTHTHGHKYTNAVHTGPLVILEPGEAATFALQ